MASVSGFPNSPSKVVRSAISGNFPANAIEVLQIHGNHQVSVGQLVTLNAGRTMVGEIDSIRACDSQNLLRAASTRLVMESSRINRDAAQPLFRERGSQRTAADVAVTQKNNLVWPPSGVQSAQ